jgi:hypothetical protein
MLAPTGQHLSFSLDEVHDLSIMLLSACEENGANVGLSSLGLALSFGRLLTPQPMDGDEEIAFIKAMMQFGGAYFTEGMTN